MTATGSSGASPRHTVVITTSYPSHEGDPSGHFVQAEVRALRSGGQRVTVLAPRVTSSTARTSSTSRTEADVRWLAGGGAFGWPGALARLKARPWRALGAVRFVLAARRELRALTDAERVIAHFVLPCAWPITSSRLHLPLEVVAHGSDVRLLERLPRFVRRRIAVSLRAARIRCASAELASRLERALGPGLVNVPEVVCPPLELPPSLDRTSARRSLGVAEEARLVVVVGRLLASKRVDVALRALTLVPGALTVVVGSGPEQQRLERDSPSACFVGLTSRERALEWIAAADVLLSASRLEGAPTVVREARALGTRVVAICSGDLALWSRKDPGLSVLEGCV